MAATCWSEPKFGGRAPPVWGQSVLPHPFDTTTSRLFQRNPRALMALTGRPTSSELRSVDPVLPAVSIRADTMVRGEDPDPWLSHLEFQPPNARTRPSGILG